MFLVVTHPYPHDYKEYFEMNQDSAFQREFANLKGQSLHDAKAFLENKIDQLKSLRPKSITDLAFIRIAKEQSENEFYDSSNSKLIGFISLDEASNGDFSNTGFKTLLNYGIIEKFRNKGLMSYALKMRLQKYLELEYSFIPAYIKGDNPASENVLKKCGFIRIIDDNFGSTFVKKLYMDDEEFNEEFVTV